MPIRTFRIPVSHGEVTEADLNTFLRSNRVVSVDRHFVSNGELSFWAFAVEYLEGTTREKPAGPPSNRSRIDYREILSPEEFSVFARLRDWRKETANTDGVPLYTVFTNDQLAQIIQRRVSRKSELTKINGVGEGRVEKYGDRVLKLVVREPFINHTRHGCDFLGCRLFPTHTKLNRRSRQRFRHQLQKLDTWMINIEETGEGDERVVQQRAVALFAFAQAAGVSSWQFRKNELEGLR